MVGAQVVAQAGAQAAPQIAQVAPQVAQVAPQVAPEIAKVAPEIAKVVPDVAQVAPQISGSSAGCFFTQFCTDTGCQYSGNRCYWCCSWGLRGRSKKISRTTVMA